MNDRVMHSVSPGSRRDGERSSCANRQGKEKNSSEILTSPLSFLPSDTFPSHLFSNFPTIPGLIPLIFLQIMSFLCFISGLHLLRPRERWGYKCQLRSALGSVEEILGSIKCQWHSGESRVRLAQQMEALLSWRGVMFFTNTQAHTHSSVRTDTHAL